MLGGELRRYRLENSRQAPARVNFLEIRCVKLDDFTLYAVDTLEAFLLDIRIDRLGHASDCHVDAEVPHERSVGCVTNGFSKRRKLLNEGITAFAARPAELLIIHGMHGNTVFFGGDDNSFDVLLYGYKRAGLDVVVSPVGYEIFDSLAHLRCQLYFVKDDD